MEVHLSLRELDEKVYWENIFEMMEMQEEVWKEMYRIYLRLNHQTADPRLLQQVSTTIQYMAQAFKELEILEPCFVQEPRMESKIKGGTLPIIGEGPFKY
jgi:hypothetical protein